MTTYKNVMLGTALSVTLATGVQATDIGAGIGVSVGGDGGISAGLGASLGGGSGASVGAAASVGGSSGVNADAGASLGGDNSGTSASVGAGVSIGGGHTASNGGNTSASGSQSSAASAGTVSSNTAGQSGVSADTALNLAGVVVWSSDNVPLGIIERTQASSSGQIDAYLRVSGALAEGNKLAIVRMQPREPARNGIRLRLSSRQFMTRAGL